MGQRRGVGQRSDGARAARDPRASAVRWGAFLELHRQTCRCSIAHGLQGTGQQHRSAARRARAQRRPQPPGRLGSSRSRRSCSGCHPGSGRPARRRVQWGSAHGSARGAGAGRAGPAPVGAMSSLAAAKADNFRYPPDFDPKKHGTLNRVRRRAAGTCAARIRPAGRAPRRALRCVSCTAERCTPTPSSHQTHHHQPCRPPPSIDTHSTMVSTRCATARARSTRESSSSGAAAAPPAAPVGCSCAAPPRLPALSSAGGARPLQGARESDQPRQRARAAPAPACGGSPAAAVTRGRWHRPLEPRHVPANRRPPAHLPDPPPSTPKYRPQL